MLAQLSSSLGQGFRNKMGKDVEIPAHIYFRPLQVEDVDKVVELEAKGFPPDERATREKVCFVHFNWVIMLKSFFVGET